MTKRIDYRRYRTTGYPPNSVPDMQMVVKFLREQYGEKKLQNMIILRGDSAAYYEDPTAACNGDLNEGTGHRLHEKFCPKCRTAKSIRPGQVEFYKNRSRPDGFSDWCKICHKESMNKSKTKQSATKKKLAGSTAKAKPAATSKKKNSSKKNSASAGSGTAARPSRPNKKQPAKQKPQAGAAKNLTFHTPMKTCAGCGNDKPADLKHFNRSNRAADKLDSLCKECRNLKKRQVRQANKFTLSIDFSDRRDLFGRLQQTAKQEERTMEAQVRYWLKLWLNVEGDQKHA